MPFIVTSVKQVFTQFPCTKQIWVLSFLPITDLHNKQVFPLRFPCTHACAIDHLKAQCQIMTMLPYTYHTPQSKFLHTFLAQINYQVFQFLPTRSIFIQQRRAASRGSVKYLYYIMYHQHTIPHVLTQATRTQLCAADHSQRHILIVLAILATAS